jgi:predicted ABC-type sugar transport system permease subunit
MLWTGGFPITLTKQTRLGRHIYAAGGNEKAAQQEQGLACMAGEPTKCRRSTIKSGLVNNLNATY